MPLSVIPCLAALANTVHRGNPQIGPAIGAVVGVMLFIRGFMMLREKRVIMNTPSSKIRSAAMGLVEVNGTARGPQTIPAGITGEPCYYYRAIAWQLRQSGKNESWKKVADESLYVPFFVDDSTGRLLIDPQGAELDVHRNFKDEFGGSFFRSREMLPANLNGFLARNALALTERTRLEEYCIEPEYPLFVLGTLSPTSGNTRWTADLHIAASRGSLGSRVSFFGPSGTEAFRSIGLIPGLKVGAAADSGMTVAQISSVKNSISAGAPKTAPAQSSWSSVSMDETAHARPPVAVAPTQPSPSRATASAVATAEPESQTATAAPPSSVNGFDLHPPTCLCKGANHDPFMISCRSQREIVKSMAWKSTLCIWCGPILTLVCLYFLALTLGWT